jgi:tetratricopeptide (TPR) repeat protein
MEDPTLSMPPDERREDTPPPRTWGPFRLDEKVGQGSFGEVFRAFDTVLEREVALKLLRPGKVRDGVEVGALREARSIAKVRHPNVVPVYGIAQHDGRVGFWSEFVHGQTLAALLASHGPFGPRETALIGIDLCKALGAVHAAGLLHRDIKPANVMREAGGRILLMDFGLTQERDGAHHISGTLPYMAPELLLGAAASVASDLYALGVLLFNLLTGKHPFEGGSYSDFKAVHESGPRLRLMDERPDLSEQLAAVIETATDVAPEKRYASAGLMIAALSEAAGTGSAALERAIVATPAASHRRRWLMPALAIPALFAVLYAVAPLPFHRQERTAVHGAQSMYLEAQDQLDHYYKPHNIENAVALFEKVVSADPAFASGYAGLGRAYWWRYRDTHDTGSVEPAKTACARALELDHENVSAHVTLGMIYADAGRTDLAAEELKQAMRLNTRSAEAYSALAELYQKEGRTAEVEPAVQKAIDLAPGAWRYLNQLGLYYLSAGKYGDAAAQFEEATRLNPDNARAYNNLGLAYWRQDRLAEARAAYEESLAIAPAYTTLSNLGTILEAEGKNEDAAAIFQRAVAMNPSSYQSLGNLASAYNRVAGGKAKARENYLKAISVAEEARRKSPNDAGLAADLASFYAAVDMGDRSSPLLRQAIALAPENPQVLYRVAEAYELLHRREDALKWIGAALRSGLSRERVEANPELSDLRADPKFPPKNTEVR